jgi:hypothetical protein
MALSFSQSLFDQPAHRGRWPAFLFQKPQAIPQSDDFSLLPGVHPLREQKQNNLASATMSKA